MSTHMHMAKSGWPSVLVVWCFVPPTTVTPAYSGQGDPGALLRHIADGGTSDGVMNS